MRLEWRTDNPPDENERYLVTYESGSLDICWWSNNYWGGHTGTDFYWHSSQYCHVKAWMPLPRPYHDPLENITQYIEDHCDEFSDEIYKGLWEYISEESEDK